jgi:hypothetical protein
VFQADRFDPFAPLEVETPVEVAHEPDETAASPSVIVLAVGVKRENRLWLGNEECER